MSLESLDDLLKVPGNLSNINKYFKDLAYQRDNVKNDAYKTEVTGFLKDLLNALAIMYKDHNYTNDSLNKVLEEMANSHIINSAGFSILEKFIKDFDKFAQEILKNTKGTVEPNETKEDTTNALIKSITDNQEAQQVFRTLLEHSMDKSVSYQDKANRYNEQLVDGFSYIKSRYLLEDSKKAAGEVEERKKIKKYDGWANLAINFGKFVKDAFGQLLEFFKPSLYDALYIGLALFGQYVPKIYEFTKSVFTGIKDFLQLRWLASMPFVKPLVAGLSGAIKEVFAKPAQALQSSISELPGMKKINTFIKQIDEYSTLFAKAKLGEMPMFTFNKQMLKLSKQIQDKLGFFSKIEEFFQPLFRTIQRFTRTVGNFNLPIISRIARFITDVLGKQGLIFSGNIIKVFSGISKAVGIVKMVGKFAGPIGLLLNLIDFFIGFFKTQTSEGGFIGIFQRCVGGLANLAKVFGELGAMITNVGSFFVNKFMDLQHWIAKTLSGAIINCIRLFPGGDKLADGLQVLADKALGFQENLRLDYANTEDWGNAAGQGVAWAGGKLTGSEATFDNGKTTFTKNEESTGEKGDSDMAGAEFGRALAKSAHAGKNGIGFGKSLGRCGLYVGNAVERVIGKKEASALRGNGKDWAINLRNTTGKKYWDFAGTMSSSQLSKLPAGSILSWPASTSTNGTKHPWGHVEIADGKGNLVSDFSRPGNSTLYVAQDPNLKPNVFTPKETVSISSSVGEPITINESDQKTDMAVNPSTDDSSNVSSDDGMSFDQLIAHLTNLTNFTDTGATTAINNAANSMAAQTNFADTGAQVKANTNSITNVTVQGDSSNTMSEISDIQLIQQMCAMPIS